MGVRVVVQDAQVFEDRQVDVVERHGYLAAGRRVAVLPFEDRSREFLEVQFCTCGGERLQYYLTTLVGQQSVLFAFGELFDYVPF
jgi:hypothetical protein